MTEQIWMDRRQERFFVSHEKEGTHHLLDVVHQLVKGDEGELGLEVGVLGEMAAGVPAGNSVSVSLKASENGY